MRTLIESRNSLYGIVKRLCDDSGITIAEMCRQAEIRPGLLSDLKSGKANSLSMENLRIVADFFDVSMDVLFDRNIDEAKR